MKKSLFIFLLIAFLFPVLSANAAGLKPENFSHTANIQGEVIKGSMYRVSLSGDVLQHCTRNCRDIRVFDQEGREVPYAVLENRIERRKEAYPVELIGFQEDVTGATVTMKMPDRFEPVNNLTIGTTDRDFRTEAALYGSEDRTSWSPVTEDVLYDFSSQVDLRKTRITFPTSGYKYYMLHLKYEKKKQQGEQLSLKYNGLDLSVTSPKDKNIRISSIQAEAVVEGNTDPVYDEIPIADFSSASGKNNETIIIFKTGIPLQRIYLDVSNPYYFRKIVVYWDEDGKTYPREVGRGSVFRFPIGSRQEIKDFIDVTSYGNGYYKVVIENDNNPRPDIKGVKLAWVQKQLFFTGLMDSGKYRLSVGSNAAEAPVYDLPQFVNAQNWNTHVTSPLSLSATAPTADYRPAIRDDRKAGIEKMILIGIVLLLVAGIGFWLYTLMKKFPGKN
jgi:hypothetical protein